eukprot:15450521-Alexandrium_andersonii.AAC.1
MPAAVCWVLFRHGLLGLPPLSPGGASERAPRSGSMHDPPRLCSETVACLGVCASIRRRRARMLAQ